MNCKLAFIPFHILARQLHLYITDNLDGMSCFYLFKCQPFLNTNGCYLAVSYAIDHANVPQHIRLDT